MSTIIHTEQYKGRTITVEATPDTRRPEARTHSITGATYSYLVGNHATLIAKVDGRSFYGWSKGFPTQGECDAAVAVGADAAKLVAKVRRTVDTQVADEAIRQTVLSLIGSPMIDTDGWVEATAADVQVGDVAAVYGTGSWRQGIVTKVGKTNATVAYSTPSSRGRVYRKAAKDIMVRQAGA